MKKIFELNRRNIIVCFIYLFAIIGLLGLVVKNNEKETFVSDASNSIVALYDNVYEGAEIRQYFEVPKNSTMDFISIQFATYNDSLTTEEIVFSLFSQEDELLDVVNIDTSELSDNAFYSISLNNSLKNKSGKYYFTIKGEESKYEKLAPAVYCTDKYDVATKMTIDGSEQAYNINAIYKYSRVNYSLYYQVFAQLIICVFISFVCCKNINNHMVATVLNVVMFLVNFVFIEWITETIGIAGVEITFPIRCMTYILMLCIQLIVFGLCGNVYLSIIVIDIILTIIAVVNYFVMIYRGVTIVPSDIFSVGTLTSVMDTYTITFTSRQLVLVMWVILWIRLNIKLMMGDQYRLKWSKKKSILIRKFVSSIVAIVVGIVGLIELANPVLLEKTGIISYIWNRNQGYFDNGPFMNFMVNVQYAFISKPEGYTKELAESYLKAYETENMDMNNEKATNIIFIMNESLADFDMYGNNDVTFNEDPLPFIHSLTENTIKGECYVSIFGSGTSNSEMEALTGNSMAFFPNGSIIYQQFPQDVTSGIVKNLKQMGYSSIAMHPCAASNWNRDLVYESMGFDTFYDESDFTDAEVVRWTSDRATYDKIIDIYENKDKNERLFITDITMQGHGGYGNNTDWENPITVVNEDFPQTKEFLSSSYVSDQAFKDLVEYFQNEEERTLVFMFGDHQPAVENEFYELMLGKSLTDLTLEETQRRYVTPYVLWTNYDIESDINRTISANQISGLIQEYAGLKLSSYQRFIQEFSRKIPVINANGFQDKNGIWYSFEDETPYDEELNIYRVIQYGVYCDGIVE